MAHNAPTPFGISWGGLGLLMLPALMVLAASFVVLSRGHMRRTPRAVLVITAVAAGVWTFFTVGASTMITRPDGVRSECVWDPWGHGHGTNAVDGLCDRALTHQLVFSIGPSTLMLVLTVIGCVAAVRRRRRPVSATS
jgi:hypothetical protein